MIYKNINFDKIGDAVSEDIINAIDWNGGLPKDYKQFLLHINGGIPNKSIFNFTDIIGRENSDNVLVFYGITCKYQNILSMLRYRGLIVPQRMLIMADALEGNLILISLKNPDRGKVYHWDARYESEITDPENVGSDNLTLLANSFDEFLGMLYKDDAIS